MRIKVGGGESNELARSKCAVKLASFERMGVRLLDFSRETFLSVRQLD